MFLGVHRKIQEDSKEWLISFISFVDFDEYNLVNNCDPNIHKNEPHVF